MDSPSDRRCKRSAGPGKRRCSETAFSSSLYCEKHYLQKGKQAQKRILGDRDDDRNRKSRELKIRGGRRSDVSGRGGEFIGSEENKKKERREEEFSGGSEDEDGLVLTEMLARERKKEEKFGVKGSKVGSGNSVKEIVDSGEGKINSFENHGSSSKAVRNGAAREKKPLEKVISTYPFLFFLLTFFTYEIANQCFNILKYIIR